MRFSASFAVAAQDLLNFHAEAAMAAERFIVQVFLTAHLAIGFLNSADRSSFQYFQKRPAPNFLQRQSSG